MVIQPTQPQGIGGVLDTAFHLYKSSFGGVWPLSLLLAVVNAVPIIIWIFVALPNPASMTSDSFALNGDAIVALLIALICGLLGLWLASALFLKQRAVGVDEQMSIGEALRAALPRQPAMLLAGILFSVALVVGMILLVVPFFILMVSLILYLTLVLFENKGALDALIGSHKLVWGNWWRSCAVLTVMGILLFVILFALSFVLTLVTQFASIAVDVFTVNTIVQTISNIVFYLFLGPLGTAVLIALYWDLKLRKEGGDLAARVNALHAA